jgi:hypothetical protein
MHLPRILLVCCLLPGAAAFADKTADVEARPEDTEVWTPVPPVVHVDKSGIPSDAVVLFGGKDLLSWQGEDGKPAGWGWILKDDTLTIRPGAGALVTKESFSDCQLHIEWRSPAKVTGEGQNRGNSGIFFMGRYEVQILDSYENKTYVNGQAASIYKQYPPLANASKAPGEWQAYDIIFTAPRFNNDGSLQTPAYFTVFHNGVLVQNHVEVKGATAWKGQPAYEKHPFEQPLSLQDHGSDVSFRNIWIRRFNTQELLGRDLHGWYSYLEDSKFEDPENNFRMEDGVLHIMGKHFGYLATVESYKNFHLKAVFKWGEKQWPPRETGKRDSGILYHFASGEPDAVWPKSIECQVQEGDCGDIWCVGTSVASDNPSEQAWGMKHIIRTADFEKPRGEWNTIEIIANGNQIEHYVNGHLVNSGTDTNVEAGRILLQSEGAEIYYKSLTITPL